MNVDKQGSAVYIDIERMAESLASGTVKVPAGLSREETIEFILSHAPIDKTLQE
jgi:hypothetical protein